MRKQILFSLVCILTTGAIGMFILVILLPPPVATGATKFLLYAMEFALILSGPLSAVIVLSIYAPNLVVTILIFVGVLSLVVWLALLKKLTYQNWALAVPIITWVSVGTFGTFWGLASGV